MADYNQYHALGHGQQYDPNNPNRTSSPASQQFHPPASSSPYQQQQQQQQPQQQQQQPYGAGGQSSPMSGPPQTGFSAGYPQSGYPAGHQEPGFSAAYQQDALATQMGGMSLAAQGQTTIRKKKKDRHAYHTVEPTGSSQPFHGMPAPGASMGQFLNSQANQTMPAFGSQLDSQGAPHTQYGAPSPLAGGPVNPAGPINPIPGNDVGDGAASVAASGQGKVSADDLPSVPAARDAIQQYFLKNVYPTFEKHVPPPASVSFVAHDQGNSSPKYARLTMNNVPSTPDGLQATGLPLGLLLQPLAPLQPGEMEIPVLDFGEIGPPRCRRCRAYINPFMMFRSGGNKFVCNLCTYPNDTPAEYYCATSPQGVRVDRDQRPELHRGTVEFVVPKEYWTREPVGLRFLFLIDVTQESFNKGFLEGFCDSIQAALYGGELGQDGEPQRRIPEGAKVGFVTYDQDIHFYNINPGLEQAQMLIMPDLEDPFLPIGQGLFVDPYECKSTIVTLLNRLPEMFSTVKNPEPAMLAALSSALAALEGTGGKVICSCAALPTWGPGRLFLRDDGSHPGGESDKKLYTTEHPAWKKVSEKMAASGVGVDFFLAAPSGGYLDIGTIGHVAAMTGGETFYYPNFIAPRDSPKLSTEIVHAVTRETGFQALMKVRCSNGLQIAGYHGNFVQHTFGADLEIGVIDSDKAIGVSFSFDGKLDAKLDAHFQSALLYTTASGQRRVRCSNIIASVSDTSKEAGMREQGIRACMKFVDQDAVIALLAKEAATKLSTTSSSLKDTRHWLTERTIDIMSCYRKHSAQQHPPGQLVMPERLKEFCMYMLGLIKCRAFKGGIENTDRRVHEMRMIRSMGALELSLYLYPRMIPLHNLQPEDGFADAETGHLRMPPCVRASFSRVEVGGVYLIDNGQQCLIWFHSQTSPNLISDLFGDDKDSLKSLDAFTCSVPVLETHLNAQVRNMMEYLKSQRGSKGMNIQLARQGMDGAEFEFARLLVEDRNNEAQSYVDWLVHVHKGVQLELSGQRKREGETETTGNAFTNLAGLRPSYW